MNSQSVPRKPEMENEAIAIVGMGCRWAGGVKDPAGLHELLVNHRDGWREFHDPRFSTEGYYHPSQTRPGSIRTRGGFLLDEDAREFDHSFFGISQREAETLDPNQRKLLEVVYESFENAGETFESISGSNTGVFVGSFTLDHIFIQARDWDNPKAYAATGADPSVLANRISYIFNLQGPSVTTTTACSSSMYALHLAVGAIRRGDCDNAVVAAANWIFDPTMSIVLDKLGALSPTSRCHAFDARADGYARGEGYAAIYLKRSSIAAIDGSPIRACIRGTAINANGRTGGITRPSASGQEAVIRKAYKDAGGLPFSDTTFFECHGTGTQAGDPIEVAAIGSVFASSRKSGADEDRLFIGSVKTNLGHTEGASALASVMKVVLAIEAGEIPPSYGIETLNPKIDFEESKVIVVKDKAMPWPVDKPRRASVNSFGFGGTNAHCIIDHVNILYPHYTKPGITQWSQNLERFGLGSIDTHDRLDIVAGMMTPRTPDENTLKAKLGRSSLIATTNAKTRQAVLLPFSAHSPTSLKLNIAALSAHAASGKLCLADAAYTLANHRSRFQHRSYRIVDKDHIAQDLTQDGPNFQSSLKTANAAFVFTGQGAQWSGMGKQLFQYQVFAASICHLDTVLSALSASPSWTLKAFLSGECEPSRIDDAEISQTVCTALQIGLVDLLASWSVRPCAVVGHSSGEMAAAYAGGYVTAAQAITAAFYRGKAVSLNGAKGCMLAVGLKASEAEEQLDKHKLRAQVKVAAINAPNSVTLSGDDDAIEALSGFLGEQNVFNRKLRTGGNAYHSHHMLPLGAEYYDLLYAGLESLDQSDLRDISVRPPGIPWISSVHPETDISFDGLHEMTSYWRANLESPVQFASALEKVTNVAPESVDVLIELGPHSALKGPIEQTLKLSGTTINYLACVQRGTDNQDTMLQLAGRLFCANVGVNLAAVNSVDDPDASQEPGHRSLHGCMAVDLPIYQYTTGSIDYYESRQSKEYRLRGELRHDLLGSKIPGTSAYQPQWRNVLRMKDLPWMADYRFSQQAILPACVFVVMAVAALSQAWRESAQNPALTGYSLRNIEYHEVFRVPEDDDGVEVILALDLNERTPSGPSHWNRFVVSSVGRNGEEWAKHCSGFIRGETGSAKRHPGMDHSSWDTRTPDLVSWNRRLKELGLDYGPAFGALSGVVADPHRNMASASLDLNTTQGLTEGGESDYTLHPTSFQAIFELGLISCHAGQIHRLEKVYYPERIERVYLSNTRGGVESCSAICTGELAEIQGARVSNSQAFDATGNLLLEMESVMSTDLRKHRAFADRDDETSSSVPQFSQLFESAFTRLVWRPDFYSMSGQQMRELYPAPKENDFHLPQLESADMISCLVVADIYHEMIANNAVLVPTGHLRHFVDWIKDCCTIDTRQNMVAARSLSRHERLKSLQSLRTSPDVAEDAEAQAALRLHEHMLEILKERETGIDVLVPGDLLTALYQTGNCVLASYPQLRTVMDLVGFARPNLAILEIGAGTGGATREVMKAIHGPKGFKRYDNYTFTDVSAGFLASAQSNMAEFRDMKFGVFNVEEDPEAQGYKSEAYDLILASQSIHATANMQNTLGNIRKLLKPGGKLILLEATNVRVLHGLLYGTLTGYWLAQDQRLEGPFMDVTGWDTALRQSGFSGVDTHLDDYPAPHTVTSLLISTRAERPACHETVSVNPVKNRGLHLLHGGKSPPRLLRALAHELEHRGVPAVTSSLDLAAENLETNCHVLAFLDGDDYLLTTAHPRNLGTLQYLVQNTVSTIWVTCGGLVKGRDPRPGILQGLLRCVVTENPAGRFLHLDIDAEHFDVTEPLLVEAILNKQWELNHDQDNRLHAFDREIAWQSNSLWIGRIVPDFELEPYVKGSKAPDVQRAALDPDGTYIITGGLGGVGRSLTRWLADCGATDVLILSRRGLQTSPQAQHLIDDLSKRGVRIRGASCDVSDRQQVFEVMKSESSKGYVKGLIHAATVMVDRTFDQLSAEQWNANLAAKVQGTLHLHEASVSLSLPLDFFLMTTTTETLWSPPTQSAYIAANSFQESFARYRRRLGLAASCFTYGFVNDLQSDWRNTAAAGTADMYRRNKKGMTTEFQLLSQLEAAVVHNRPSNNSRLPQYLGAQDDHLSTATIYTCLSPAAMLADQLFDTTASSYQPGWLSDGRVSHIIQTLADASSLFAPSAVDSGRDSNGTNGAENLKSRLQTALQASPGDPQAGTDLVTDAVVQAVAEKLFIDTMTIDPERSVSEHGIDSLTAAELRNWFHKALSIDLKMSELLDAKKSIHKLSLEIVESQMASSN